MQLVVIFVSKSSTWFLWNQFQTILVGMFTQVMDSILWIHCASGNVPWFLGCTLKIWPLDGATWIDNKFGHAVAVLVSDTYLATRGHHFHKLKICSPSDTTCIGLKFWSWCSGQNFVHGVQGKIFCLKIEWILKTEPIPSIFIPSMIILFGPVWLCLKPRIFQAPLVQVATIYPPAPGPYV